MSGSVKDFERKNKVMRRSISTQQEAGDRVNHGRREAQTAFQYQHAEFTNAAHQYEPQARERAETAINTFYHTTTLRRGFCTSQSGTEHRTRCIQASLGSQMITKTEQALNLQGANIATDAQRAFHQREILGEHPQRHNDEQISQNIWGARKLLRKLAQGYISKGIQILRGRESQLHQGKVQRDVFEQQAS